MAYIVIARRYRPQRFEEVKGQNHIVKILVESIRQNKVGHAYLFCGPRGVGKTSLARIFAKALNCINGPSDNPCQQCEPCRMISEGIDPDVIEMDAASNRQVEDARHLRETVQYKPFRARFKIYIIDEAHMLTDAAFNTLLKTLEEPPAHVKFIFATTDPHKLPETIISRCQRFDFLRLSVQEIIQMIKNICQKENFDITEEAIITIARAARGSMRDAESLLEQLSSYAQGKITSDIVSKVLGFVSDEELTKVIDCIYESDVAKIFSIVNELYQKGCDFSVLIDQIMEYLRNLIIIKECGETIEFCDLTRDQMTVCARQAKYFTLEALLYFQQLLFEAKRRIKAGFDPRLIIEMTLLKTAKSSNLEDINKILQNIQAWQSTSEAKLKSYVSAESSRKAQDTTTYTKSAEVIKHTQKSPLENIKARWQAVLNEVRSISQPVYAYLRESTLVNLEEDCLWLYTKTKSFCDYLSKQAGVVEEAIEKVFNKKIKVVFSDDANLERKMQEGHSPKPQQSETYSDRVVKIFQQQLGARVISMEKNLQEE